MKPSSDIALFTTTLPFPVLVSLILFLTATSLRGRSHDKRQRATASSPERPWSGDSCSG